jgi:hypothetical protein
MYMQRVPLIGFGVLLAATAAIAGLRPQAASPGDPSKVVLIGDTCPTFSWGAVKGVTAYELVVYALEGGDEAEPLLRQSISGAALSWTPSLDHCLERGGRYAWSVRALVRATAGDWSKLRYDGSTNLFEIWGHEEGVDHGPWLRMARDTGTTTLLGPLVGVRSDPPCFNNTHRFVDCGNGTITDTDSGIIWLKDANCFGQHDYATANNKAADLYDGAPDDCGLSDGSRAGDWRLATFYDWTTILKDSCDDPPRLVGNGTTTAGCYSDNGWASQVQASSFWSSTSHGTTGVDRACVATPNVGTQVCGTLKPLTLHVWPVRGGRWDPP